MAGQHCCSSMGLLCGLCGEVCLAFVCAFYFFWLSASHGLRLGMDGMLFALCDHEFERSGLCAVNKNHSIAIRYILSSSARGTYFISVQYNTVQYHSNNCIR